MIAGSVAVNSGSVATNSGSSQFIVATNSGWKQR
jgi:hypothetical protein